MPYNLSISWQANFDHLYNENDQRQSDIAAETINRAAADTENREPVEQSLTDAYLEQVSAQQTITELSLKLIELEARVKALEDK